MSESPPPPDPEPKVQPIDIVYMWVNGSDPDLLESIDRHVAMSELEKNPVGPQVKIIFLEVLLRISFESKYSIKLLLIGQE